MAFELRSKSVTVTFDPQQVAAEEISQAIQRADQAMAGSPSNPKNQRSPRG
ncbi:MAG: hypothetical protein HYY02_12290 [Chloroflexi bacterium]|nr:hypothetical protein [Chloroflexota bacterium]